MSEQLFVQSETDSSFPFGKGQVLNFQHIHRSINCFWCNMNHDLPLISFGIHMYTMELWTIILMSTVNNSKLSACLNLSARYNKLR